MGAPAKFLFDLDFAAPAAKDKAATAAEIAARVAEAEARGYEQGFAAAQAKARADTERRVAVALGHIGEAIEAIAAGLDRIEARMEAESVEVALAVARKLSAELIAREPLAELTALIADCFRHLVATPHLVVRVSDALYDHAKGRIEELSRRNGFEGRLVILADPDIAHGDGRVEWADGGITLDRAATETKIAELIGRYIASRQQASKPRGTP
ncbi:MAG: flagellar assembly protein H [Xanthobacteraceae bacterium]|nr:MAG: flagellar assembly protein H [Xanthobacteraceae bacterium]